VSICPVDMPIQSRPREAVSALMDTFSGRVSAKTQRDMTLSGVYIISLYRRVIHDMRLGWGGVTLI